jgi:hypothetical protein
MSASRRGRSPGERTCRVKSYPSEKQNAKSFWQPVEAASEVRCLALNDGQGFNAPNILRPVPRSVGRMAASTDGLTTLNQRTT